MAPTSAAGTEAQAAALEAALRSAGDRERAASQKRYLKSDLKFIGVSVPGVRQTVRDFLRTQGTLDREDLLRLVDTLWETPVHETHLVAIGLLRRHERLLQPEDLSVVEGLLRTSYTWAYVDDLAVNVAGALVERYPQLNAALDRWARDDDFWLRRSSMLALLRPIRRGAGDFERFARYADSMLEEREFFIRKAIGWVLREASKQRPGLVYEWLASRAQRASGVTMREAVKYLTAEQRGDLLAAYRERRSGT